MGFDDRRRGEGILRLAWEIFSREWAKFWRNLFKESLKLNARKLLTDIFDI